MGTLSRKAQAGIDATLEELGPTLGLDAEREAIARSDIQGIIGAVVANIKAGPIPDVTDNALMFGLLAAGRSHVDRQIEGILYAMTRRIEDIDNRSPILELAQVDNNNCFEERENIFLLDLSADGNDCDPDPGILRFTRDSGESFALLKPVEGCQLYVLFVKKRDTSIEGGEDISYDDDDESLRNIFVAVQDGRYHFFAHKRIGYKEVAGSNPKKWLIQHGVYKVNEDGLPKGVQAALRQFKQDHPNG